MYYNPALEIYEGDNITKTGCLQLQIYSQEKPSLTFTTQLVVLML